MFAENPRRYAPALGGDCIVTFAEAGKRTKGNPKHGILHNQRLYFFVSADAQRRFEAHPAEFDNADLANGGRCLVSQMDHQTDKPGLPSTTAIIDGLRYQFAGTHEQQRFLADMPRYGVKPPSTGQIIPAPLPPARKARVATPPTLPEDVSTGLVANPALEGYCPVSIYDAGIWTLGNPRFRVAHEGRTYVMAGKTEQERFATNPAAYLPATGGDCIVNIVESNQTVPGSIHHAALYDGRLYLLAGENEKQTFSANPSKYVGADREPVVGAPE